MTDSLFYTPVSVENGPTLKALIDSGPVACTRSKAAEANLLKANLNLIKTQQIISSLLDVEVTELPPKGYMMSQSPFMDIKL